MKQTILIYTDYPYYGLERWNQLTVKLLSPFYNVISTNTKNEKPFLQIVAETEPALIIFSDKSPESCKQEKIDTILRNIPFIIVTHLVSKAHAVLCNEIDWVKTTFEAANKVIAVSESTLANLRFFGLPPEKGVVVYPCISSEFFSPKIENNNIREIFEIPKEATLFVTVARVDKAKGYQYQLEILKKLHNEGRLTRDMFFLWVGDGSDYFTLGGLLQTYQLHGNVFLPGSFPPDMVLSALQAADAFILPSLYEGTPIALLEAIAQKLPICATRIDGISEVLNDENAILLPNPHHDNAVGLKTQLEKAYYTLMDETVRKRLSTNIASEGNKYTEEVFTKRMLTVIKEVLKEK